MTHEKERRSIQCFERPAGSSCRARDRRPRPSGYPPSLGPVPRLDPVPQRAGPETGRWTLVVWLTGVTIHHELANAQPFGRHPNRVTGLGRPRAGVPRTSTVGLCEVGTRIPRSCSPTSNSRIVVSPLMQSAPAASQAPQPTSRPGTSRDSSQLSRKGRPRSRTTGPSRADRHEPPDSFPAPTVGGCLRQRRARDTRSMRRGYPSLQARRMAQSDDSWHDLAQGGIADLGEGRTISRSEHRAASHDHRSHWQLPITSSQAPSKVVGAHRRDPVASGDERRRLADVLSAPLIGPRHNTATPQHSSRRPGRSARDE